MINIDDNRLWEILFEEACVEGKQAKRIYDRLKKTVANGWIPADERLPEEGEKVLVWYEYFRYGEYNRMYETYGISWQYDGYWSGDVSGTKAKCIAWQPLPESYLPADKMEKPDWMKDMLKKFDRRE